MKTIAIAFVLLITTASQAQAFCWSGPSSAHRVLEHLVSALQDAAVSDGDRDCFNGLFDEGYLPELCRDGAVDCLALVRDHFLSFYDSATISHLETVALRHRHRLTSIFVRDSLRPERGDLLVIETHCWDHGRAGHSCRIRNLHRN